MSSPIQVRGPDGQMFRFPAGTDENTMANALDEYYGRTPPPEMSRVEAVGRGVADGMSVGFGDEISGLVAASRTGPQGFDRFRDDEGNFFTDTVGAVNDAFGRAFPAFDVARGGVAMFTGPSDEQRQAYETTRDSMRDGLETAQEAHPVSTLAGQIGGGVLSAALTGGASASPSIARAAAVGAGYGGAYGFGSGEGVADRVWEGAQGALIGGVTGGALQGVMNGGGKLVRRIRSRARPEVSQIDDALQRGQIDDATAQRLRDADGLGIELTRGQQTGDRAQIGWEEAARRRSVGSDAASELVEGFDATQRGQIDNARLRVADRMSPTGTRVADDTLDATGLLQQRLQGAARSSNQRIDAAYRVADAGDGMVQASAIRNLGRRVREDLNGGTRPVFVDDSTPMAARALSTVDELTSLRIRNDADVPLLNPDQYTIAGVRVQGLERVRQRLNRFYGSASDKTDRNAVREIIRAYDDFLDDAANARLMEGTDEGVEAYQRARALFHTHRQRFGSTGRRDEAGRLIEELLERTDGERLPDMANAIFGRASSGEGRASLQMAERVRRIFGPESQEMAALRQGLFARAMGLNGDQPAGTDAIVRNLNVLLNGNGRAMAARIFTPDQLSQIRKFYGVLRAVQTPRDLTNPSGTAGVLIRRHAQGVFNSLTRRALPIAGEVLSSVGEAVSGAGPRSQARQAVRGVLVPQGMGVPGPLAGAAGYSGLEAYQQY